MRRQQGFTIVELVIVIVIAGILAIGSVQFIGQATQGYADAGDRQQLATIGWIASEKISRELRNALPNSLRINAGRTCLEFVPVIAASHYIELPDGVAPHTLTTVTLGLSSTPSDAKLAVYPTVTSRVYGQNNPGPLSVDDVSSISTTAGVDTITLGGDSTFLTDSPERRFYLTQDPIMFCFVGRRLNRYSGYGFNSSMTTPSNPQIIVDSVQVGSFDIAPESLTRNAVVTLYFELVNGATHIVDQEVQIRNVP